MTKTTKSDKLVRLQPVLTLLQAILWTGRIEGEAPVSACLVAESQSAKSQALLYFSATSTVRVFSDVTSKALLSEIRSIETEKIRHIILLDLHMLVSHNRYTADRTLLTLGGLMEEGLATVADAGSRIDLTGLPKIGVLMATTPRFFFSRQGFWRKTGFLTRFLTISYKYSNETIEYIHDKIREGMNLPDPTNVQLPDKPLPVTLKSTEATLIEQLAVQWGNIQGDHGFRFHRQLRRLAKACALIRGSTEVSADDVAKVSSWLKFLNPQQPATI